MDIEGYKANISMYSATVEQRSWILGLCLFTLALVGRLSMTLISIFLFVTEILYMSSSLLITSVLSVWVLRQCHILTTLLARAKLSWGYKADYALPLVFLFGSADPLFK